METPQNIYIYDIEDNKKLAFATVQVAQSTITEEQIGTCRNTNVKI